ncbi:MAG: RNA polymerase sigma factor [Saprospiraceae bacterium]|nr:RNA polymerase sigma factor [Saprospiraceae bacterium]
MKHKLTDEQLLELIGLNKESGFRTLMHQYQEQTYWHIRRMVTTHEDADDVVQNTFIKIFKNLDKFKGDSKLYTWIYRIATNESLTFLKKRKKRNSESIDESENTLDNKLVADAYFDGNEVQLKLQRAIIALPEKQKAVFNLRYYEEMPYNDMSEILETSVGALKASYHHAVKKIEEYIRNEK